ncbi:MAG: hypothetical protein JRH19_01050 [Deltaproteobacteria bacterium]|nr:hypothetical protein [Deltaproteobacteria bacterium]
MRLVIVQAVSGVIAVLVASSVHALTLHPGDLLVTRPAGLELPAAVVRVDPLTGARSDVALLDNPGDSPAGIAIDANGDLLVAEWARTPPRGIGVPIGEYDVVRVDPATGAQDVVVSFPNEIGSLPVTPHSIAIDASGDLLVTDF